MDVPKLHNHITSNFQTLWQDANDTTHLTAILSQFLKGLSKSFRRDDAINFIIAHQDSIRKMRDEFLLRYDEEKNQMQAEGKQVDPNSYSLQGYQAFNALSVVAEHHKLQSDAAIEQIIALLTNLRPLIQEAEKIYQKDLILQKEREAKRKEREAELKKTAHKRKEIEERERKRAEIVRRQQERQKAARIKKQEELLKKKAPPPPKKVPFSQALRDSLTYQELNHKEEFVNTLTSLSSQDVQGDIAPFAALGFDKLKHEVQSLKKGKADQERQASSTKSQHPQPTDSERNKLRDYLHSKTETFKPYSPENLSPNTASPFPSQDSYVYSDAFMQNLSLPRRLIVQVKPELTPEEKMLNFDDRGRAFLLFEEVPQKERHNSQEGNSTTPPQSHVQSISPPTKLHSLSECIDYYTDRVGMIEEIRNEINTIGEMPSPHDEKKNFVHSLVVSYEESLRMASFTVQLNARHPEFSIIMDLDKSVISRVECNLEDPRVSLQQMFFMRAKQGSASSGERGPNSEETISYNQLSPGGILTKLRDMITAEEFAEAERE